jgi:tetratricopeptide (TPR) repeat protein
MHRLLAAILVLILVPAAHAGLYYSGEPFADLPSQWRGFLLDQRTLRNVAVKPVAGNPPNPARQRYLEAAAKLDKASRQRKLTADEQADLGALYVRLGELTRAVEMLRGAAREHPTHFHIAANLGTAWQLQGDLNQAAVYLEQAVHLAPGKMQRAEEYHLKLVRLRKHEPRGSQELDDLFGVRYVGEEGKYQANRLAVAQAKKLPADAAAVVQQLALWLPADGRLLWQLAELANAHGDVKTAAAIMDGCVDQFGLRAADLRQHRQVLRAAADELAKAPVGGVTRAGHDGHAGTLRPRSRRPLLIKLDESALPPISATGVNPLPWAVISETTLDRKFKPTFAHYLRELDGKQIALAGFVQPLGDDAEMNSFMLIEYPVGCWYCEAPEITGIVLVALPKGKTLTYTRGLVKVEGKLKLNDTEPENFLYTITDAKVAEAD